MMARDAALGRLGCNSGSRTAFMTIAHCENHTVPHRRAGRYRRLIREALELFGATDYNYYDCHGPSPIRSCSTVWVGFWRERLDRLRAGAPLEGLQAAGWSPAQMRYAATP